MIYAELFFFGAILGSFINVLAVRYDPDRFLLGRHVIGGRSHCPHCQTQLRWFELIPMLSFILQRGRCRTCKARLSSQYLTVEIIAGLIVATVPMHFMNLLLLSGSVAWLSVLWIIVFLLLLLMSLIDIRLYIIPDEINVALAAVGIAIAALTPNEMASGGGSLIGSYALLFGGIGSHLINRAIAFGVSCFIFGSLILVTRGRGMGQGDWKLGMALAFAFGWPDNVIVFASAFIIGAVCSLFFILGRRKTLKSFLPFGPFMAFAAIFIFFYGRELVHWYFSLFPV